MPAVKKRRSIKVGKVKSLCCGAETYFPIDGYEGGQCSVCGGIQYFHHLLNFKRRKSNQPRR